VGKFKLIQFFFVVMGFIAFKYCLPERETFCEINEKNRKLIICGIVIKKHRDSKNHNYMEIKLSDKTYLYEKTEFEIIVNSVSIGDSICKPLNSLVFFIKRGTPQPYASFDTAYASIELPCDSLNTKQITSIVFGY